MGKFKECLGFWNKEIRLNESCQRHTNGSTVGRKAGMFYKRTIAVLVIAAVAASAQGTNTDHDLLLYRLDDTQSGNETMVTTAAYRDDLMDKITPNDTESDQTTMSWLQFMEDDVANWNDENGFDVAKHIRLKRAIDGEGSGSGSGIGPTTTEDVTTGDFTTTSYVTEPSTGSTESNTEGSGFDETTTQSESTTESATSLPETSSSVTVSSMSPGNVTKTTEAGSGMEETTLSATSTSESSTENPTSAESTVTNPSAESSTSPNDLTATTEEGSGMEDTTSTATVSDETTTSFPTESTAEVSTTTTSVSCDSVTCPVNEYCVITDADGATCNCVPGYHRDNDAEMCSATKVFGGILHLNVSYESDLGNSSTGLYIKTASESKSFLEACYQYEAWFVAVEILGFDAGSTLVIHQIFTKDETDITASTVEATFSNFISNDTFFNDCTCDDPDCVINPSSSVISPMNASKIIANASCSDAGTRTDVVCETTTDYCSTGTSCNATSNGDVSCACNANLVQDSNTTCIALICSSSFGCNQPFGTCDTTDAVPQGRCVCMWGFQGTNCQIIWVFVLVLCIAGVVLIAIIVAIAWWCRRRHHRRKSYDSNPYSNAGAMTVSLERYNSLSDWDEKIGGVVPTSYKRISDSENVDSAYERSSASGDFEQNSDARGVTLRNWRVSEIGTGDRESNGSNGNKYVERPVQLTTFQQVSDDSEVIGQTRI